MVIHKHGPTARGMDGLAAHDHGHDHAHDHAPGEAAPPEHAQGHRPVSRRRLLLSMALTGAMMVVEVVAGLLTGSLALVSDAGHMFTHFFALGISYFAIRIASMPAGPAKSFGLYRAEVLAALFNGIFLAAATVIIAYESVVRFFHPVPIAGAEMMGVAVLGLLVNLVSAGLLWNVSQGDLNVRSAYFHMLGDTLSSVAVVAGAGVIMATGFVQIDPILSAVIAIVIGIWSWRLLAQSVRILMEVTPPGVDLPALEQALREADPAVLGVHDLHVWEITSGMLSMTAIAVVRAGVSVHDATHLMEDFREIARDKFHIGHAIIQVESEPCAHAPAHEG